MLCLVSAIKTEISGLIELFGARRKKSQDLWIASDPDMVITAIGVGFLESAINLTGILNRFPTIDKLIFTGSAGVYPNVTTIDTGDLCCCRHTILADGAAESGQSLYADPLPRAAIQSSLSMDGDLVPARIATLLTLTRSNSLAVTLQKQLVVDLENMELFGVARVCSQRSIAWNAVLGVTNRVGENGHVEWQNHFRQVAEKTGIYLYESLMTGDGQ